MTWIFHGQFHGYLRNSMWNFEELIKNEVEFHTRVTKWNSKGDEEKIVWNFQVSWILVLEIFQGIQHNFVEFPGEDRGGGEGSKKYFLNPPGFFSEIAQHIQCLTQKFESHLQERAILLFIFYINKTT